MISKQHSFARAVVDACVIGAGAAGAVVAQKLGQAGLSVLVLEAGPRLNPSVDYPARRHDFEVAGPAVYEPKDPRRDLYTWCSGPWFHYSRIKAVGGSALVYTGISRRFHQGGWGISAGLYGNLPPIPYLGLHDSHVGWRSR